LASHFVSFRAENSEVLSISAKSQPLNIPSIPLPNMADAEQALIELISSYHDLNAGFIPELNGAPTPLEFLRRVHRNQPVVFKGAVSHWKAVTAWNSDYMRSKMGSHTIMVAETPFG
jgi:hypothetical protein